MEIDKERAYVEQVIGTVGAVRLVGGSELKVKVPKEFDIHSVRRKLEEYPYEIGSDWDWKDEDDEEGELVGLVVRF